MTAYAGRADVYKYGLTRGSIGSPGRIVASALAATSAFELDVHGFETNDAVTFRAADGGTLPSPIVEGTIYYAIKLTASQFKVAATPSGSAITLTTDGTNVIVGEDLPVDDLLEFYSRFVDGFLPAHVIPLPTPYPITVVAIVAELVARRLQLISGIRSDSMQDVELSAKAQLERWAAGIPVRDAPQAIPANLSVQDTGPDPRGWANKSTIP